MHYSRLDILILSFCLILCHGRPFVEIVAPMHGEYASLGVLMHCMAAQTDSDWILTVVTDGPDASADRLMASYASLITLHDPHIAPDHFRMTHTPVRTNDWGHSPRALGLAHASAEWTILSGVDNYYAPKFVEFLRNAASRRPTANILYWDFVLDRKGSDAQADVLERTLASFEATSQHAPKKAHALPIVVDGVGHVLSFDPEDDLESLAASFVDELRPVTGNCPAGEDGRQCVQALVVGLMQDQLAGKEGYWRSAATEYAGHVSAELSLGHIDIGAVAFRTSLGVAAGYLSRSFSADWDFIEAILKRSDSSVEPFHIPRTLYVHN